MGRRRLEEPRDRQLLVRVSSRHLAILEAAAFLDKATPTTLAHQHLTDWLDRLETDPSIQVLLETRIAHSKARAETHAISEARSRDGAMLDDVHLESARNE